MAAEAMIKSLPKELPAPTMADILLSDHRETMVLLKHHAHVAKTNDAQLLEELTDAISLVIRCAWPCLIYIIFALPLLYLSVGWYIFLMRNP